MNPFKWFSNQYKLDKISPTVCGAKWFEGTIWLDKGVTASCHHTPFDKIKLDPNKPSSLFNSPTKTLDRIEMLLGKRPEGCNYCWTIEDKGGLSDRTIKTNAVPKEHIVNWTKTRSVVSTPYMLEIAFDRTCNLACAYCGPAFSTKWVNDIKINGDYQGLVTDSRYSADTIVDTDEYVDAFFAWWPELESTLKILRITGGEPLMSPSFWKFLDCLNERDSKLFLIINSNLINHKGETDKLIEKTKKFKTRIHTSMESSYGQAEYIRDGFDQRIWDDNIAKIMTQSDSIVNVTTAITNLTVWSYIDYLRIMLLLKKEYGSKRIEITCNFVNYPVFMRIDLIPIEARQELAEEVAVWYKKNRGYLNKNEKEQVLRYIKIVGTSPVAMNDPHFTLEDALEDLKKFVKQYDQRRGKSFATWLDYRFVEWYNGI